MPTLLRSTDSNPNFNPDTDDESTPGWVKASGIITVLLLLFVIWHVVGGGNRHGQHLSLGDKAAPTKHRMPQP